MPVAPESGVAEGLLHLRTHLEGGLADAGADRRQQSARLRASLDKGPDRQGHDATHHPSPTRMNGGNETGCRIGQKHGGAIRHTYRHGLTGIPRDDRVRLSEGRVRPGRPNLTIRMEHTGAMHLPGADQCMGFEPAGMKQACPVGLHMHPGVRLTRRIGQPEVQRVERRRTDPTDPRTERVRNARPMQQRRAAPEHAGLGPDRLEGHDRIRDPDGTSWPRTRRSPACSAWPAVPRHGSPRSRASRDAWPRTRSP